MLVPTLCYVIPYLTFTAALQDTADVATPNIPSSTAPTLTKNVSVANKLQIECNANLYGQKLKVPSCKKIFDLILNGDKQISFAERHGLIPSVIALPYRLQSGIGIVAPCPRFFTEF